MEQALRAKAFSELHRKGDPLVLYNIWDAGSAKAVAAAGAKAIATGSWSVAAANGYPDGEAIPLLRLADIARSIVEATELPVTIDFEGGYAVDPDDVALNVARIVEDDIVALGLDPSTVRRAFKRTIGTTFLDYARHRRLGLAARHLSGGGRVIEAQFEAGYESPSGFRAAFARLLGKAPAMSSGNDLLFADWTETPLGPMVVVGDQTHLHLLEFHDRKALPAELRSLQAKTKASVVPGRSPPIEQMERELTAYFSGESAEFKTPLALNGSDFEKKVWRALLEIPVGETRSYGDIARKVDTIDSVRAVARANGTNRIAIVVPCHRCIGADGSLTGYGGGLWRKQWLLRHEAKMRPAGLFAVEQAWNKR